MAIDTTIFGADIPAGTYAAGDVVELGNIAGPTNVRSGRGAAILKSTFCAAINNIAPNWRIHIVNSDWIDEIQSFAGQLNQTTVMDKKSGCVQSGHNLQLTPNSSWRVYAECVLGATSTTANSVFALIDVDYPEVSAIQDPAQLVGYPTTIEYDTISETVNAVGTIAASKWSVESVDYFKAGFEYCLNHVEMTITNGSALGGFIAFSNAAGMGGLQRIIPINTSVNTIRYAVEYASKLVKGPMDVKLMLFGASAGTCDVWMCHDYVKRRI